MVLIVLLILIQNCFQPTACIVRAAGIENSNIIADEQLTAISQYNDDYQPRESRLNSPSYGYGWKMEPPYKGNSSRVRLVCVSNVRHLHEGLPWQHKTVIVAN